MFREKLPLVSIVIPARNEEDSLGKVLDEIFSEIQKLRNYAFEVIVVDNNSTDRTSEIAVLKGAIVLKESRPGKGMALAKGFEAATGDIIIMMDADYSHSAKEFHRFLSKIESGYGLVIGSRQLGRSDEYTLTRRFGNLFLTKSFRILFGYYLTDALNGFKAFRKEVVTRHDCSSKDFEIEIELIYYALKENMEVGEVESHERERFGGKMKSHALIHGPKFLAAILKYGVKYRLSR